ncbi:hypothetical protein LCGC14_1787140, partial [marine sediment metagenome]
ACLKIEWEGVSSSTSPRCRLCDCYDVTPQWIPWYGKIGSSCVWWRDHRGGWSVGRLCGDMGLTVSIKPFGDVYRVTVWQGFHTGSTIPAFKLRQVWQRDYASPPDVSAWDQEEIPRISGQCPSGCDCTVDAKVLLTADFTTSCDDLPWDCWQCRCQFFTNDDPPDVQVTIEGVEWGECCTRLNGTFILTDRSNPLSDCQWKYTFPDNDNCSPTNASITFTLGLVPRIQLYMGSNTWTFRRRGETEFYDCNDFDIMMNEGPSAQSTCRTINMPFPRVFTI